MQLAAVEYLNISGLVIDFATSPVRTGNSFFGFLWTVSQMHQKPVPVFWCQFLALISGKCVVVIEARQTVGWW